ncbi:chemotaxis protein CheW [Noviherbaspirillum soli]|uniref:chemotaxis protein CheW n=1 Tax=Noviherbaspirillum soli TaxID=1064518 RepID=UPI00389920F3
MRYEEHGLNIFKVQEIRGYDPETRIANTSDLIRKILTLYDLNVPVSDPYIPLNLR